ncbi:hypothetical protein V1478_011133 [Vespula squamosa]|uniref:Uncharacterized protein n=1 Tax=Vespula squamosa TaxID=30214 RepID=A0ABD2AGC4_VESSQ
MFSVCERAGCGNTDGNIAEIPRERKRSCRLRRVTTNEVEEDSGGMVSRRGSIRKTNVFTRYTVSPKVPLFENFERQLFFCEPLSVGRKLDAERPSKKNMWIKEEHGRETPIRPAFVYEQIYGRNGQETRDRAIPDPVNLDRSTSYGLFAFVTLDSCPF